jgi:mono/diheme cytochrome c family protein
MRILLRILVGLVVLVVGRRFAITEPAPAIPTDSASIARGRHLVVAIGKCVGCHKPDFGGDQMIPESPFATVASANLTSGRGGIAASRSDAQLVNAIRHGVSADGRPLFIMPTTYYRRFSDQDVGAIVAYLRTVAPVDREFPPSKLGPIGRTLFVAGQLKGFIPALEFAHDAPRATVPQPGVTAEYGEYLVDVGVCRVCHGAALSGGAPPGDGATLAASNLTPEGLKAYDEAAFIRALREGVRPGGTPIDTSFMPISLTRQMTDDEIRAVWMYLRTIPAKPFGAN